MSSEFDTAVTNVINNETTAPDKAQAAREGYVGAVDTNPDEYAEMQRVARRVGVPTNVAMDMPQEVKKQASIGSINFDTLAQTNPATASLLADTNKAKIAHDDVPNMTDIEKSLMYMGASGRAGLHDFAAATAKLLDTVQPFTTSDEDLAVLYKNDPEGLKRQREHGAATVLSRFARNQTQDANDVMSKVPQQVKDTYGNLEYQTLDPEKAAYLHPVKVVSDAIRSMPTTAALALTAFLTRGASMKAETAALDAGVAPEVAKQAGVDAAVHMATRFGAGSEGAVGYAQQYNSTQSQVEQMPFSVLEKSPEFQKMVGEGFDPNAARIFLSARTGEQAGVGAGFTDAITNVVGGHFLGKIIGGGGNLLPRIGKGLLTEGTQEFGQSGGEQLSENLALKNNINPEQDLSKGVVESMLQGLAVGGLTGGTFSGIAGRAQRDEEKVRGAGKFAEDVIALNGLAKANKVLQREYTTFEEFAQQAGENGNFTHVFIDAEALMQSGVAEQIAALSPSVAEQLPIAAETKGTLSIPVGEYTAAIAPTEYAQALVPIIKKDPFGFSQNEATEHVQNFQENMVREMQDVVDKGLVDDDFKQSTARLKEKFQTDLDAVGHHTTDVNKTYATLLGEYFAVNAAKQGMTPEESHNQYALRFASELQQGYDQSRVDMHFKDVTKRIEGLTIAANDLKEGKINREDYDRLVNELKPVTPYTSTPEPSSTEAMHSSLTSDKVPKIGRAASILPSGDHVGLRLDIPAYRDHGTWVVSIHSARASDKSGMAGKAIGYDSVAAVTDARFGINEKAGINIAAGKPKATIATVEGKWAPITPEEAHAKVTEALQDPEWVQVGMDPERHSYFYDRKSMEPVVSADEVVQIGPLVMAKNPVYAPKDHFLYQSNLQTDSLVDVEKIIMETLDEAERRGLTHFGVRVSSKKEGRPDKYEVGDSLDTSTNLNDYEGWSELDGVSTYSFDYDGFELEGIDKALLDLKKWRTGDEQIILVGGIDSYEGQMTRERVILSPSVLHIFSASELNALTGGTFDPNQIKSATSNNGNFDPNDANVYNQSAPVVGANAITGDLDRVNPDVKDAVESRIARMGEEEQQRVHANLEAFKSTSWAAAAIKGMAYREMLERALVGEDISNLERNAIWGKQDMAATKIVKAFKKYPEHGDRVLKLLLNAYDFIGGNRKAENDVSTSFTNCDPSEACAVHCYAANSNARPSEIAKSEFTEFMIEHFPQEMANKIAGDYLTTEAGKSGLSLRLNDKGDLSPAQVNLIKLINDKGVAVQVFSKRPELLRELSDINLKMLSVDGTNLEMAEAYPDLRLAVVITDEITEEMLTPIHDRVSVYLPVNLKGKAGTKEELKSRFPTLYRRMIRENLCPVDGGKLETKPGTSFVDIRDKTADKGVWTCTACDLTGVPGCFKGDRQTNQRKAQTISLTEVTKELRAAKVRKELQKNLEELLNLGGIDGELYSQLSQALSTGQRAVLEIADSGGESGVFEGASGATQVSEGSGSGTGRDAGGEYNQGANTNRGSFNPTNLTISLLKKADLTTFLHETGHFFLEMQMDLAAKLEHEAGLFGIENLKPGEQSIIKDANAILKWFGVRDLDTWHRMSIDEKRGFHEQLARGFEAYLFEGIAPSIELQPVFQRFKEWLKRVYKSIEALNVVLTDEVRGVFDRMLASDEQIQLAQQARSMMPLFATLDAAPMSADEFREYQNLQQDATASAVDELDARGLRDMKWLRNARSKVLKAMQKDAKEKRREVRAEARIEVLSQPIYRAWALLTAKINPEDRLPKPTVTKSNPNVVTPEIDSLFAAVAKLGGLNKSELMSSWDLDPAYKPYSGVFGKPTWRKDGGLSIDSMLEALTPYGYLTLDHHGKPEDSREFEELFDRELRGDPQYSFERDYNRDQEQRAGSHIVNPYALNAVRFDKGELLAANISDEDLTKLQAYKMVSKGDGMHQDIVADLILDENGNAEFTSGDDLIQQLLTATPPNEEIEALTDLRMLERYGDLSSPGAIEKAADKAIHNDLRARLVATEANALAKATGGKKILASAAKMLAATTIARKKIRDLIPSLYTNAEVKAAKSAEKYMRAKDLVNAAAEKRNQLFNMFAAKAAMDARDEVEKGLRYLKKFNGNIKGIDADYADQIAAILSRFDLRKISNKEMDRRKTLDKWLTAQEEEGLVPDLPEHITNEAFIKPYKELSVEEFRGVIDSVKQIEHLGRLKKKLLLAKDQREFDAIRDEIVQSINDNSQGRIANTRTINTGVEQAKKKWGAFAWGHAKVATLAKVLDGGNIGGPVWEFLIRPANERGDWETTQRAEATLALSQILAPVFNLGKMGGKGLTFQTVDRSFNREARIAIALNVGNEGNLQRLLGGEGWSLEQIMPILKTLTREEWTAVQAIWDHFETYRPLIAAKERRVYGKEPNWVEPTPFNVALADGETVSLRGGYYPIKYDPAASQRAEEHSDAEAAKRQIQGAYTSATTRRSFTKTRAEEVKGRPLLYSLSGVYPGVNDVIHDLAWHEWLIDTNRLIKNNAIDTAIRQHYGPEFKSQFKTWTSAIAEGEKGSDNTVDIALSRIRQGVSVSGLGFNVMSAAMQPTGITQSISVVGANWVGLGVSRYLADIGGSTRNVNELSEFMANRARTRFRELNELRNSVEDQSPYKEWLGRYAYFLMMRCQQMVDVPTWIGAYEKAQAEGVTDDKAIALADQAVIDSQGSGMLKDLSAIERGGAAQKLFTVFYSYMNTALNVGISKTMSAEIGKRKAKLAADYLLLYVLPPVLGFAIKEALTPTGDDDDDYWEKLPKRLVANQIDYLMGLMVVVREFSEAAKLVAGVEDHKQDYQGPAGVRMIADSVKFGEQLGQGEFDTPFRKSFVNLMGDAFALPSAQINRTVTGIEAISEGKTSNPAAIAFGFKEHH